MLRVEIADPMSGFFMIRRDRFEQLAPQLSTQGFKILLDIVATAHGELRTMEIPYTFGSRLHGESKLDSMVALDFLGLVLAKLTHDVVSLRFLLFAMVGALGLRRASRDAVHRARGVQRAVCGSAGRRRARRHDQQLHPQQFSHLSRPAAEGLCDPARPAAVLLVCSVGLLANVGVAFSVYDQEPIWWLAGAAGALMGVVWNYAMSGLFVWRKR